MDEPQLSDTARHRAESKLRATAGYVYGETLLLAVLPLGYGILTIVLGDALWLVGGAHGVFESALEVPLAPESWGSAFMLAGTGMAITNLKARWGLFLAVFCSFSGLFFMFFSLSFLLDAFDGSKPSWGPALVYAVFAMLCMNRARLAWLWKS
ncbi:membrane protein [Gordonia phage Skog]|uniref:Membrane protein n=1 Tax=Gordonia phage Skog TaxID=2704033 RepID=A0A6G6XJM7_9CAUD|nr:membrane protein [Gordonia phage Skog]QIG58298.1 membrane protein [Gordonia phage Skog]